MLVSLPTLRSIATSTIALAEPSDALGINIPDGLVLRSELRAGHGLPLWRTRQFYGETLVGDPQGRVLYPPMGLYVIFAPPFSHDLYILVHLLVLSLGTYALLRSERRSRVAAVLGAVMIGLSHKAASYAVCGWEPILGAMAWVPLGLLAFRRAMRSSSPAPRVGLGLALAASIFADTPFYTAHLALVLPLAGLCAVRRLRRGPLERLATAVVAGFGLAALFAAPILLGTLATNARSARSLLPTGDYGIEVGDILRALAGPDLSHENYSWETSNYLGLFALALAGAGLVRRGPSRRFAGALLALTVAVAAGRACPPVYAVVSRLPLFRDLSNNSRLLWVSALAVAILAARGLDALAARKRRGAVAAAVAVGALLSGVALQRAQPDMLSTRLAPLAAAPFVVLLARGRGLVLGAVAATALDLLVVQEAMLVRVPWSEVTATAPIERLLAREEPRPRIAKLDPYGPFFEVLGPGFACNGLDRADGYDPLHTKAVASWLAAIAGGGSEWNPRRSLTHVARPDLLAIGTTHVLGTIVPEGFELAAEGAAPLLPSLRYRPGTPWPILPAGWRVFLHKVPGALPRAYVVPRARSVPENEQLAALLASRDARRELVVDGPVPPEASGEAGPPLAVAIESYSANVVRLRTPPSSPGGWCVLLDAWSPDWDALLDAESVPVLHANALFRAIAIGPGAHAVTFRVHLPRAMRAGFAASALGLVLAGASILLARGARFSRPAGAPTLANRGGGGSTLP